jgi:hypothetical protein
MRISDKRSPKQLARWEGGGGGGARTKCPGPKKKTQRRTYSPRRASRGAPYGRKSERLASWAHEVLPARLRLSIRRGVRAAPGPRRAIQSSDSIELERRNKRHGAPGGTGYLVACPLAGGASSWLGWVTARRRRGRAWVGPSPPHRQDRASSFRRPPLLCECVCRSGPGLGVGGGEKICCPWDADHLQFSWGNN